MLNRRSASKRAALRESLWAGSKGKIWPPAKGEDGAKGEGGWTRVPRTISIIACVFAENSKGEDLLQTYLDLLARVPEEGIIEVGSEEEHAALSGFTANARGVKSWRTRLRRLEELGFIRVFAGSRPFDQIVLVHPTLAMAALRKKKQVSDALWAQFQKTLVDTGVGAVAENGPETAEEVTEKS